MAGLAPEQLSCPFPLKNYGVLLGSATLRPCEAKGISGHHRAVSPVPTNIPFEYVQELPGSFYLPSGSF